MLYESATAATEGQNSLYYPISVKEAEEDFIVVAGPEADAPEFEYRTTIEPKTVTPAFDDLLESTVRYVDNGGHRPDTHFVHTKH